MSGTAAAIVGHSPMVALAHYRRASAADLRRATDALEGIEESAQGERTTRKQFRLEA